MWTWLVELLHLRRRSSELLRRRTAWSSKGGRPKPFKVLRNPVIHKLLITFVEANLLILELLSFLAYFSFRTKQGIICKVGMILQSIVNAVHLVPCRTVSTRRHVLDLFMIGGTLRRTPH